MSESGQTLLAPERTQEPVPPTRRAVGWRAGASQVTAELQREASRRIQVLGLAACALGCLYGILLAGVFASVFRGPALALRTPHLVVSVATALLSLALVVAARSRRLTPQRLLDLGLVYEVTIALSIALLNLMLLRQQGPHSLQDAHATGLIHRDIKPANIFVCRKGQDLDFVKVLDFGLVKTAPGGDLGISSQTIAGQIAGTPAFMAPEQAIDPAAIDARADLYAFGCVAYWLLTGRYVFAADTPMGMLVKHVNEAPAPPSQHSPQPLPATLERLVLDCLAKSPAERPADAAELARRLAACASPAGWTAHDAQRWWQTHAPLAAGVAAGA